MKRGISSSRWRWWTTSRSRRTESIARTRLPDGIEVVDGFSAFAQRHAHRLQTTSRDPARIDRLYRYTATRDRTEELTIALTEAAGVPTPRARFHRRRKPNTGQARGSRAMLVAAYGESDVAAWEAHRGRSYPPVAELRFGDPTLLGVVAHEVAHHVVNVRHGLATPAHGKVWVAAYDEAARSTISWLGSLPTLPG